MTEIGEDSQRQQKNWLVKCRALAQVSSDGLAQAAYRLISATHVKALGQVRKWWHT